MTGDTPEKSERPARKPAARKAPAQRKPRAPKKETAETPAKADTSAKPASSPGQSPKPKVATKAASPMNIVVRAHWYPPLHNAGSEWMMHSMLRALVARGHECTVWLSRYSPERAPYEIDGVKVIPFAARMDFTQSVRHADVVVSYLENVPAAGALAQGFGKPFVVIVHNSQQISFRNMCISSPALAVYNSQFVKSEAEMYIAEKRDAPKPRNSIIVHPPVFPEDYQTTPGDCITLINLNVDKGGNIFWRLAERFPDKQFLAVKGAYGEQIVRDLPNVTVLEHMTSHEMRDKVYARTRVLLVPSVRESWGRVAVEAMCSGIPVVASPVEGLPESLGEAGIFADAGDIEAWSSVIERLDDEDEWKSASKRAAARASELDPADDLNTWCEAIESLKR